MLSYFCDNNNSIIHNKTHTVMKITTSTELCQWSSIAAQIIETAIAKVLTPEMIAQLEHDAINKKQENWGKWIGQQVKFNLTMKQGNLVSKNLFKLIESGWHIEHNGIKFQLPMNITCFEMHSRTGKFGEYIQVQFCFFVLPDETLIEPSKTDFTNLIGECVFVDGWQNDNGGTILDGIITSIEYFGEKYGHTTYKISTKNGNTTLPCYILQNLLDKGSYQSNPLLNTGTNAVLNPKIKQQR